MIARFVSLAIVASFCLVPAAAQPPDLPSGITSTRLAGGVYRFDRPASQSAYWWQLLIDLFGWEPVKGLPFRRSVAFLAGVSKYESLQPRQLGFVETDVTDLRNVLLTSGGFDTVFEARNEAVTRSLIEQYMANQFTSGGQILTGEDRLLFYYSGHGTDQAGRIGYLQFSKARDRDFSGDHILAVRSFQEWAQVNTAKHLLVILDSCASGLAIKAKSGGSESVLKSLSGEGSGHLLTAGYGPQKVYGVDGKTSVLTGALINALRKGSADQDNTGFMTINQIYGQVQIDVGNFAAAQGKKVNPQLGDLPRPNDSDGTFVFLNSNARNPSIPERLRPVLTSVPKGNSPTADGPRLELVRLAFESLRESSDLTALKMFVEENKEVAGAATLVAIIHGRIRNVEQPASRGPKATITTLTLPSATVDTPYVTSVDAIGGSGTRVWAATGLPPGLSISSSAGQISGTPRTAGTFSITTTLRDGAGETSTQFSLIIEPDRKQPQSKRNNLDGLTYVWIPPGRFRMGCSDGDKGCDGDEKPAHNVEITRGFWIGQTEVTQAAWTKVMGSNPSNFFGAQLPVQRVSWEEASQYCSKIGGRLPTEAEWKYAAGDVSAVTRHGGALHRIAWYSANSEATPHPVAQLEPNGFGLYDMLGNVWEWMADWYGGYHAGNVKDPRGPSSGSHKIARGGAFDSNLLNRAWSRSGREVTHRDGSTGVRCAGEFR